MWFELYCSGWQTKSDSHFLTTYGNQVTSASIISSNNTARFCKGRKLWKKLDQGLIPKAMVFLWRLWVSSLLVVFSGELSVVGACGGGPCWRWPQI